MYQKIEYVDEARTKVRCYQSESHVRIVSNKDALAWEQLHSGAFGEIGDYTPLPKPKFADILASWRSSASCDILQLQDAAVDNGFFDDAENLASSGPIKWRIRWESRAGCFVTREMAAPFFKELHKRAKVKKRFDAWFDDLVAWQPEKPME